MPPDAPSLTPKSNPLSLPNDLAQRLQAGPGEWVPLEDFATLPNCLEWRLSRQYWDLHGTTAFYGGEVPYGCINDGRLSADTARFVAEIRASNAPAPLRILEVGGGSGLFARLFLDALRAISPALYSETRYLWTDGSPTMVQAAEQSGVFAEHGGRVEFQRLELPAMEALASAEHGGFDLIIANYVVDNLPASLLRCSRHGLEQLEVRATLRADVDQYRLRGRSAAEWAQIARTSEGRNPELVELYPWFSLECRFRPVDRSQFKFETMLPEFAEETPIFWSHHELACSWLAATLRLLKPGGGVLLNDYGHLPQQVQGLQMLAQHFGGSLATGINLTELAGLPKICPAWQVCQPESDSKQLLSRWVCGQEDAASPGIFRRHFAAQQRDQAWDLIEQARAQAEEQRTEMARSLFWQAYRVAPRCWHLLQCWGSFCLRSLREPVTAQLLAEQGLILHPGHPALWTLKGQALLQQSKLAEAKDCFERAVALNPREVSARLGLASVQFEFGRDAQALAVLAQAMALDSESEHRDALLEKQGQILLRIARTSRDALAQQLNRFRNFEIPAADKSLEPEPGLRSSVRR